MSHIVEFSPIPSLESIGIPITAPIRDDSEDLIPGLLPMMGQLVVAGETNVGKSLLALEMISSLINGTPLWGELMPKKKINKVLYCLGEHYAEVIMRLAALTKLPFNENVIILGPEQLAWDKWLVTNGNANIQSIKKFSKWLDGIDLVVFDPLAAFVQGADSENDNVQMRLLIQTMNDLAHAAGASCLILAHQGKPTIDKFGQEQPRKSYAIRGASAIEDAATNIFYMGKAEGSSQAAQNLPGGVQLFSLVKRKYKGIAPNEYRLMRDHSTLTHTLLGNRPFVEVQKIAAQANISKLQAAFPGMSFVDAIKTIATIEGKDERTIRRWLEAK